MEKPKLTKFKQVIVNAMKELDFEWEKHNSRAVVKFLNYYVPLPMWENENFQTALSTLINNDDLKALVSTNTILLKMMDLLKQLKESPDPNRDVINYLKSWEEELSPKEFKVYVPVKGLRTRTSFTFTEGVCLITLSEGNLHEYFDSKILEQVKYLMPTAFLFNVTTGDSLKAMEIAVEGSKIITNCLKLLEYFTWNEESLSLRLPGHGPILERLMVTAISDQITSTWELKEPNNYEFEIDDEFSDDLVSLGGDKIEEILHNFISGSMNELEQSTVRAITWFAESRNENDIAARFLKLMLAVETLLITNGSDPITATLCDRVAFVLGNEIKERIEYTRIMRSLYSVRSEVVHHGASSVDPRDLTTLEEIVSLLIKSFLTSVKIKNLENKKGLELHFDTLKFGIVANCEES